MTVPYTFGTATTSIPLSNLDANFNTPITLGNTSIYLGNTTTTIGNLTLTNATISSGTVNITNVTVTTANVTNITVTGTANIATGNVTTLTSASITDSGLTSGRVTYAGASGLLSDSADFTYDATKLLVQKNGASNSTLLQLGNTNAGGAGSNMIFSGNGNTAARIKSYYTSAWALSLGTDSFLDTLFMVSGNVGIGTTSPTGSLEIATSSATSIVANSSNATGGWVEFKRSGTAYAYIGNAGALTGSNTDDFAIQAVAGKSLRFQTNGNNTRMMIDSSGNLGLGVTPSTTTLPTIQSAYGLFTGSNETTIANNAVYNSGFKYVNSFGATKYYQSTSEHSWHIAPSGTAGNAITFTQAMTLDASGILLVGTTSALVANTTMSVQGSGRASAMALKGDNIGTPAGAYVWNATTTGDGVFFEFGTEASFTTRGSISYNRSGGLTAYNTTSDYRAKDIISPVLNSGEVIDSVPVYMGKMKGATQARPMFIAHETPDYAHTGEKDAIDEDGNLVFQQMDVSSLVPVLWAEIQSLRKRLATLEAK